MSFHGGLIGIVWLGHVLLHPSGRFWDLADLLTPACPWGTPSGGSAIHQRRALGRATASFLGDVLSPRFHAVLRHPSRSKWPSSRDCSSLQSSGACAGSGLRGRVPGLYLIGYGAVVFSSSTSVSPTRHRPVLRDITIGQILCLAMMLAGAGSLPMPASRARR
jgi:hypothetical protein